MSKPIEEPESKAYIRDIHFLYLVFSFLKNPEDQKKFLKEILTFSELRMIKKRWHIAHLLIRGDEDIRTIASITKSSTQTVVKMKQVLEHGNGGLNMALKTMYKKMKKENKDFLKSKRKYGGSLFVKGWFD